MSLTTPVPTIGRLPLRPLVTVKPDATLAMAARVLRASDVSALVVGIPGDLVAILTERDVTAAVADGRTGATAGELATASPVTVDGATSLVTAARAMLDAGIRHLVVVDGRRAVGVVSMRDVLAALLSSVTPEALLVVLRSTEPDATELWLG